MDSMIARSGPESLGALLGNICMGELVVLTKVPG